MHELYSDAYLLAVNKPGGMPVQPDPTGDMSLFQLVQTGPPERPDAGMPHRVDRPVSGVVLFTLTAEALAAMSALFAEQRVHKMYWAVVEGTPGDKGSWMHRLTHDAHAPQGPRGGGHRGAPLHARITAGWHRAIAMRCWS